MQDANDKGLLGALAALTAAVATMDDAVAARERAFEDYRRTPLSFAAQDAALAKHRNAQVDATIAGRTLVKAMNAVTRAVRVAPGPIQEALLAALDCAPSVGRYPIYTTSFAAECLVNAMNSGGDPLPEVALTSGIVPAGLTTERELDAFADGYRKGRGARPDPDGPVLDWEDGYVQGLEAARDLLASPALRYCHPLSPAPEPLVSAAYDERQRCAWCSALAEAMKALDGLASREAPTLTT